MEFSSGYGGGGSGDDHHDASDPRRGKKRYHRHTAHQIQRLEAFCPHPDEKIRLQLSRELNLNPRQIKFWFQNRRTQMKAQFERADNCALRAENDKIRCENIAIREALKNVICPSCGGPPVTEDSYFDEQKLRIENVQLKEELDRVSSIAAKYIGRPISQLQPVQPIHVSSLDLSMASFSGHGMLPEPSLNLHLLPGSSTNISNLPFPTMSISDMDKSLMADVAGNAMDELIRLLQTNEPLWMKSTNDGREILNLENYERIFPGHNNQLKNPNIRIEASRDSGVVIMNGLTLVDMFMDVNKWMVLFPTIVSRARTVEVLSSGMIGIPSGALQLMYEELQVLSPLVPTRQFYFLRFCQQIKQGSWAIVDISYDLPHQENQFASSCKTHRLLSGCLIQDMPNGYSKVTWVEHWEIEDKVPIHGLYMDLIHSGLAFGAEKWLSSLQRICERYACLMGTSNSTHEQVGVATLKVIPSSEGKRSMMKLAQRMVNNFCASLNPSNGQQLRTLSGSNDFEVRATLHKSTDPGQPNAIVLSAASTIWLPIPPENVFNFFRDERTRPQWDVLSNQNPVQEVAHIANGSHPGNCISVLRALNSSQSNMLILQESCIDSSGSLVVYCPVDLHQINIAMNGEDPSYIPLLPSGLTISPDGRPDQERGGVGGGASTSSNAGGVGGQLSSSAGSLITVVFQILVSNLPYAKMSTESVTTINNLISNTVHQIKAALNCTTSR
ncbi:homeobox-leucine zipper HDG11 [Olea europaea subsp. europaea]|uniref:Homeobox-leucine zipper HDG11 n=1 Tax=Olea europaea subsp. europaea TaxID=158383 RepID=A0A8S0Q2N7_OLEEU|nr:homeobox-leucine zipper HDG11 [Olea europaea subsp. europaea]